MWFKKTKSDRTDNLSVWQYLISGKLWLSIFLSCSVYAINLYTVWLMNKDAVAITCLLFLSFTLSAYWRLSECKDREGWYLILVPLSDFATVIFALACVSTIPDADFKPVMMKPVLMFLAGIFCGVYGFSLCREILSIEYDKTKRT